LLARARKHVIRSIGRSVLFELGVRAADWAPAPRAGLLRVLMYHRIDEVVARDDLDPSLISATPAQFAAQLAWMSRDFDLVSLGDVLAAVHGDRPLPRRAVLLTFDDAYLDFQSHAWPILRDRAAPATLFVPTGFPDEPQAAFWWDRLYGAVVRSDTVDRIQTPFGPLGLPNPTARERAFRALKQRLKSLSGAEMRQAVDDICEQGQVHRPAPAVMGWQALKTLADEGVTLAPHTHTHPFLDRIPEDAAREEIRRSRGVLEARIGGILPALAYPSGHLDERVAQLVREEGFEVAFTTVRGVNDLRHADPVMLRRTNIGRRTPDALIRLQMTAVSRHWNRPLLRRTATSVTQTAGATREPNRAH